MNKSTVLARLALAIAIILTLANSEPSSLAEQSLPQNQETITLLGHIGGVSSIVAVHGDYTYINFGPEIAVVDTSDMTQPKRINYIMLPTVSMGNIELSGNYAFITHEDEGDLRILNISNPIEPIEVGLYDESEPVRDVAVKGNYAYVAIGEGIHIVDISDPTNPIKISTFEPSYIFAVAVAGDYAFLVCPNASLIGGFLDIVDISDPANPSRAANFTDSMDGARDVAVSGNYAFVVTAEGLRTIDISNPQAPALAGFYDIPGNPLSVTLMGSFAFVTDDLGGLHIIDITNPAGLTLAGFYKTPSYAPKVVVSGNNAYVADHGGGLLLLDITNPADVVLIGSYDEPDDAPAASVAGNLIYIPRSSNVQVIDANNPRFLTRISRFETPGDALDMAVSGNYAYIADDSGGLRIYDITNPSQATEVSFVNCAYARSVAIKGNFVFLTCLWKDMKIIDVSDPYHPQQISDIYVSLTDCLLSIKIVGNYAYLTGLSRYPLGDGGGLFIVDISDPAHPVMLSNGMCGLRGIDVFGNYAFVGVGEAGLCIYDISIPTNPIYIGLYDTPGYAKDVAIVRNYAFVADGGEGVRILDVSNPSSPSEIGFYNTIDASRITIANNHIYVADGEGGLYILRVDPPLFYDIHLPTLSR